MGYLWEYRDTGYPLIYHEIETPFRESGFDTGEEALKLFPYLDDRGRLISQINEVILPILNADNENQNPVVSITIQAIKNAIRVKDIDWLRVVHSHLYRFEKCKGGYEYNRSDGTKKVVTGSEYLYAEIEDSLQVFGSIEAQILINRNTLVRESVPTLSDLDPLIGTEQDVCRRPTAYENAILSRAMSKLIDDANNHGGACSIDTPDEWLILERPTLAAMGFALGKYGVLYVNSLESEYLPAVIAHILGWFNSLSTSIVPTHYIQAVRNAAAPLHLERLPDYTNSEQEYITEVRPVHERFLIPASDGNGYEAIRETHNEPHIIKARTSNTLKTTALPELLRPKPVDVVIGGGNNYKEFGYRQTSDYSADVTTSEEDNARGLIAAMEYLDALPPTIENQRMKLYFQNRKKWAKFFKQAQEHADGYATRTFGQNHQLAELLTRYERMFNADSPSGNTVHFYQSLRVRIERLQSAIPGQFDFFGF